MDFNEIIKENEILKEFKRALAADDPKADDLFDHKFAPTENLKETEFDLIFC